VFSPAQPLLSLPLSYNTYLRHGLLWVEHWESKDKFGLRNTFNSFLPPPSHYFQTFNQNSNLYINVARVQSLLLLHLSLVNNTLSRNRSPSNSKSTTQQPHTFQRSLFLEFQNSSRPTGRRRSTKTLLDCTTHSF
jgi:hypothetical protein